MIINQSIEVRVVEVRGRTVKLGFTFPPEATVLREEIVVSIEQANRAALAAVQALPTVDGPAGGRAARSGGARAAAATCGKGPVSPPAPRVGLIMGSQSDWPTLAHAAEVLDQLEVAHERRIVSAHRTPDRLYDYAKSARDRGLQVIIAGAGGAAHLPGMVAALTTLPVLGVPIESRALSGLDSLLSIVQMPAGVPVGTLAIGRAGAVNAALLAAAILAQGDPRLQAALDAWRAARTAAVAEAPEPTPVDGGGRWDRRMGPAA